MILFQTTKPLQRRNLPENPKKIFVQKKDGRQEQGKLKEVIDIEKEVVNLEDEVEGNTYEQDVEPEPAEVFKSQDVQLEAEINANIDEEAHKSFTKDNETDSTQGSFVDAVMDNNDNMSTNEEVTSAQNDISTPERVAK